MMSTLLGTGKTASSMFDTTLSADMLYGGASAESAELDVEAVAGLIAELK